jgi:hypothetical protein
MLMVFLGVLSAIVGNIGFMGVFLERLTRQTGQLAMALCLRTLIIWIRT